MTSLLNAWATGREILSQPDVWRDWNEPLDAHATEVVAWVEQRAPDEIWLSGAGTSSFIGLSIDDHLSRVTGRNVRSVASTDLVATPHAFFRSGLRPLVVSFGRSGSSSESIGVLDLLDRFCPEGDRLNITCNADSPLARRTCEGPGEFRAIVLPEATHDAGFAMTVSFSTMLYTALACLGGGNRTAAVTGAAEAALALPLDAFGLETTPERVVFLGAGPLKAAAREACLKILELTAGRVATLWDSPLGFRHGPKSFVTGDCRVVLFKSAHPLSRAYDDDLEAELRRQFPDASVASVGGIDSGADVTLPLTDQDAWNVPVMVIPAQIAGVTWADRLGLNVDDPFEGRGNLTRVVSGVTLYTDRGW